MKLFRQFVMVVIVSICMTNLYAQDWLQYLGPKRNGTSSEKGILREWPENGPEVLWTVDLGIGFGGPAIKDGRVYLLDRVDSIGDNMRCFDLSDGEELWTFAYDAPGSVMFPGSRSVPTLDGNYIFSCGHNGDLYCIDINTHKPVWHKNVWTDFGGKELPIWAITQCPLIYGDLLILLSQAPEAGVVAYNKLTGDLQWKTRNLVNESYASPSVVKVDGEDHIVMVISSTNPIGHREQPQTPGNIVGIEPMTGKILWEYNEWVCHISVPCAVDAGNNQVLVVGGYEMGAVMLKIEKKADGTYATTEIFKTEEFGDQTKPPLLIDGYFYAQYGTNNRRDGLVCMSMDGRIIWKTKRDPDFNKGSMIYVDGLILATDGAKSLYLIEPDTSGFKPLASSELLAAKPGDERMGGMFATQNWGPIALSDGKLLIRDQSRLLCIRVAR
jgi:outer membrane protein assembly factor BamB